MKQFSDKLIQAGCKVTKIRLAVLEYLSMNHISLSARDLHKKLKHFNRASVYRTLNLFEELHIINVEIIQKEKIYCFANKPHHHIICKKCGHSQKIDCKHSFGEFKNFTDVHHRLTLTGVCNKCVK